MTPLEIIVVIIALLITHGLAYFLGNRDTQDDITINITAELGEKSIDEIREILRDQDRIA